MPDIGSRVVDPFIYQYGVGGVIFAVGLAFAVRQGYVGFRGRGLLNLGVLLGGFALFMAVQGYLQYAPMDTAEARVFSGEREADATVGHWIDYCVMGAYLVAILAIGTWFGRRNRSTKDFFFGGQRFSWWLIAFSLVATLVGSYSFVKYSQAAYSYGLASSQSYLNDWALMPLLLFGWLPILYFSRITSVPEYFGRRFDSRVRFWATLSVLIYLVSYVGVNLFTMGRVLEHLLGWDVLGAAALAASVSVIYVTFGGQTSVIMTDLFQGLMLLAAGLLLLVLGIHFLGGFHEFWTNLPREQRLAFNNFNSNKAFPSVGIFWQDAMANSAFFYFLNQGILMRFMAARSLQEARKAAIALPLILMPVAAIVVASGGWIGRALVNAGDQPEMEPREAFYITAEFLSRPGVFGLILAALTAALMSTVDTLITAVSAVAVNDVYKVYINPQADDRRQLRAARFCAVGVTLLGVALVPVFAQFDTIYEAHGAMTAAVTPPLVVALFMSVFWRRYTAVAALATIVGGLTAIIISVFVPQIIAPFAHGVPMGEAEDGLFAGAKQYKFMRACFGLAVSALIGFLVTWFTRPEPYEKQRGLVWGTVADALKAYKGSAGKETERRRARAAVQRGDVELPLRGDAALPAVTISSPLASALHASVGDLLYVADARWWLGGLRSAHVVVDVIDATGQAATITLGPDTHDAVVTSRRVKQPIVVEKLY
jgi:SSS family solute:Na+ symporter